jgi:hypothetical protein
MLNYSVLGDQIMNVRCTLRTSACVGVMVVLAANTGWADPPDGLVAFVEAAAADLASSPLGIPQFQSSRIDAVEDLGRASGVDRYLCWLRNDQGRVGYVAVGGRDDSYGVVALSATPASPDYFLKYLQTGQLKTLRLSDAAPMSFVERVPLVAATPTLLATDPIEISEIAASLSSILNYLQQEKELLFFGHVGTNYHPDYVRRFKADQQNNVGPEDSKRPSFPEECSQAVASANIPTGQTSKARAASNLQKRSIISPIIRRALLTPANARERLEALQAERSAIYAVTLTSISPGMVDAVLLQQDYLGQDSTSLQADLHLLLRTRGLVAQLETTSFHTVPENSLPMLLIGPDNIAGVLLGWVRIDGEQFVWVFFPATSQPVRMTWADYLRARGRTMPDPEQVTDPRERESAAHSKAALEKQIVAEDPKSQLPDSLASGVHLCNASALTAWRVVRIEQIRDTDNWGASGPKRNTNQATLEK